MTPYPHVKRTTQAQVGYAVFCDLVLVVCLIETTSLDLGQELTWLYVSLQVGRWRRRSLTSPATVGLKTPDVQPQRNQSNGWEPGHYCPVRDSRPSPRLGGHPGIEKEGKGPTSCPCHIGRHLCMCLSLEPNLALLTAPSFSAAFRKPRETGLCHRNLLWA